MTQGDDAATVARAVRRSFGEAHVLRGVDLTIRPGEFVALLGRSGSGKSTLLRLLAGLDVPDAGEIQAPERRAVAFQDARLLPWQRVEANVALGLPDTTATAERVTAAIDEVGLRHRVDVWPATLSGGEAQRAALARALVRDPELLLLDEPFGALDALTRLQMHALIREIWVRHRPSVLLVTHDVDEAIALADRILVLDQGRLSLDVAVGLPAPRPVGTPAFAALRGRLLEALGVVVEHV